MKTVFTKGGLAMKIRKLIVLLVVLFSFLSFSGACGIDLYDHCSTGSDCGEEEVCDEGNCVHYISCE